MGKYAFVEELFIGKFISANRFTMALFYLENPPIANVLYAYDAENDETIIVGENNSIYICDKMDEPL